MDSLKTALPKQGLCYGAFRFHSHEEEQQKGLLQNGCFAAGLFMIPESFRWERSISDLKFFQTKLRDPFQGWGILTAITGDLKKLTFI